MDHVYALLATNRSIRILSLSSGAHEDPLKGELEIVNLDSPGQYEAVSYVWGDPTRTHQILCSEGRLPITTSLYYALQRLRLPDKPRRIWADQVCINQDDQTERSQQVQYMNTIYRNARHVLVWLAQHDGDMAQVAFQLVKDLDETFSDHDARERFRIEHTKHLSKRSEDTWAPLKHLTSLQWFRRAWIVQEIGTSAPATLFWGRACIDWAVLHRVCQALADYHDLRKHFSIHTSEIKYIYQRFIEPEKTDRHANRFSFIYELHRARHLHVTDPRDRVFALLGHYSIRNGLNEHLEALQADYTKSVEEVYCDLAVRALVGDHDSLITLAAVQHPDPQPGKLPLNQGNLPSWVPDWRTYQSHILSEPTSPYRACGTTAPQLEVDMPSRILVVRGVAVDKVISSSASIRPKEFLIDGRGESQTIETLWNEICGQDRFELAVPYVNGDLAVLAYTQTLSNGCLAISWQEKRPYHSISSQEWLSHGAAYLAYACKNSGKVSEELYNCATKQGPSKWTRAANGASSHRAFARTSEGYYVLGPKCMQTDDIICVLFGGKMPFCLRASEGKYRLVGECYVHGLMNGEAMQMLLQGRATEEAFHIV